MDSSVPIAILTLSVIVLVVSCMTWRAGGKHTVMSSWILVAAALAMVFEDGSRKQLAALISAGVLIAMALMTTPGSRVKTMRLEHALMGAAVVMIWASARWGLFSSSASAVLFLTAALMLAALAAVVLRGLKARQPKTDGRSARMSR